MALTVADVAHTIKLADYGTDALARMFGIILNTAESRKIICDTLLRGRRPGEGVVPFLTRVLREIVAPVAVRLDDKRLYLVRENSFGLVIKNLTQELRIVCEALKAHGLAAFDVKRDGMFYGYRGNLAVETLLDRSMLLEAFWRTVHQQCNGPREVEIMRQAMQEALETVQTDNNGAARQMLLRVSMSAPFLDTIARGRSALAIAVHEIKQTLPTITQLQHIQSVMETRVPKKEWDEWLCAMIARRKYNSIEEAGIARMLARKACPKAFGTQFVDPELGEILGCYLVRAWYELTPAGKQPNREKVGGPRAAATRFFLARVERRSDMHWVDCLYKDPKSLAAWTVTRKLVLGQRVEGTLGAIGAALYEMFEGIEGRLYAHYKRHAPTSVRIHGGVWSPVRRLTHEEAQALSPATLVKTNKYALVTTNASRRAVAGSFVGCDTAPTRSSDVLIAHPRLDRVLYKHHLVHTSVVALGLVSKKSTWITDAARAAMELVGRVPWNDTATDDLVRHYRRFPTILKLAWPNLYDFFAEMGRTNIIMEAQLAENPKHADYEQRGAGAPAIPLLLASYLAPWCKVELGWTASDAAGMKTSLDTAEEVIQFFDFVMTQPPANVLPLWRGARPKSPVKCPPPRRHVRPQADRISDKFLETLQMDENVGNDEFGHMCSILRLLETVSYQSDKRKADGTLKSRWDVGQLRTVTPEGALGLRTAGTLLEATAVGSRELDKCGRVYETHEIVDGPFAAATPAFLDYLAFHNNT
jgi:hypothetical protein